MQEGDAGTKSLYIPPIRPLSRNDILELLEEISTTPTAEHIHILVTSRVENDISDSLSSSQGWRHCRIDRSHVGADIAIYTSS
jgi:hypothetical protein